MNIRQEEKPLCLVCTDLDGTLLDHHTYSWQAAKPALAELKERNIPVIINTSKTREEVIALQKAIELTAPFIVENGSAIYIPKKLFPSPSETLIDNGDFWLKILGNTRDEISNFLAAIRANLNLKFEGYSDWNVEKIMELTGLDKKSAKLSHNRAYSEPLIWGDTAIKLAQFNDELIQNQFKLLKGGRFHHVIGNSNKGEAMRWLHSFYGDALYGDSFYRDSLPVISLGDSDNDIDMLNIADYPVLVKSPTHDYPTLTTNNSNIYRTRGFGPEGWNEAIKLCLPTLIQ